MTTRQFDELVDEIRDERNDRALIILCSSIIDEQLFNILKDFLINPIKANEEDLLKGDTPLSTFSSRIKIIYRLGIIDNSFREILEALRKVRNLCAHTIDFKINKSPIKEHISSLKKLLESRTSYELAKKRYFENSITPKDEIKLLLVTICVILETMNGSISQILLNSETIKISKR